MHESTRTPASSSRALSADPAPMRSHADNGLGGLEGREPWLPRRALGALVAALPLAALAPFRRTCFWSHRAVLGRLTRDSGLRSALDFHLEGQRLKSKRVWVVVRARPSDETPLSCISIDRNRVSVSGTGPGGSDFFFDRAFGASATQGEVCEYVSSRVVPHALNGEHVCLLAYGQTGSGKTHTMFGPLEAGAAAEERGVAFRAVSALAIAMGERLSARPAMAPTVEFSFLEVYNDELYDLLDGQKKLSRQRSSEKHVVPQGLTRRCCDVMQMEGQVHAWLREGAASRTVGKTVFNPRSSRSHGVVMLHISHNGKENNEPGVPLRTSQQGREASAAETRIYIVDLAGSERAGLFAKEKEQLKEGEHINLSLSALGRVVSALASGKCDHVPYRDSALTWLLKDAITGSTARVCMVATVHPAHAVETASTLRYARQYSSLQATTTNRIPELTSEVREQLRRLDNLRRAFEAALEGDDYGIAWTAESLRGTVQPARNAREFVEGHPHLSWTSAHQSKQIVRGQQRDRSGVGRVRVVVDFATPRDAAEQPDGRPAAGSPEALSATRAAEGGGCGSGVENAPRVVEVVFEGRHGRPPVVLWYPELALEVVQPPKKLVDAQEQLRRAEELVAQKKAELAKAKEEHLREEQEWMAKGDQ